MSVASWSRAAALADQADEDIFQRALVRVQVLVAHPQVAHSPKQGGNAGTLSVDVETVFQLVAVSRQLQPPVPQPGRDLGHALLQLQRELLLAELFHQR